jgi:LmbE family N-acetylglucosaminyl deacetylase
VFTHDPEHPLPPYLSHRDHRVVGREALDAIYPLARDSLAFPELLAQGLAPHRVRGVWLFASTVADQVVDISASFEHKLAARLEHRSQTSDPPALGQSWRSRAAEVGAPLGLPAAEAFTVLTLD